MKILDKQKVNRGSNRERLRTQTHRSFFLLFRVGGEVEAGGAHAEREANPPGDLLPLPCQPRIPLQGKGHGPD